MRRFSVSAVGTLKNIRQKILQKGSGFCNIYSSDMASRAMAGAIFQRFWIGTDLRILGKLCCDRVGDFPSRCDCDRRRDTPRGRSTSPRK